MSTTGCAYALLYKGNKGRLYFVAGFATGSIGATLIWLQVLIQNVTVRVSGCGNHRFASLKVDWQTLG